MLSLRQQDFMFTSSRRQSVKSESEIPRPSSVRATRAEPVQPPNRSIPTPPPPRARSIDGRNSPVAALKGFFATPGRPRSPSSASANTMDDGTTPPPEEPASFSSRGNALLSMLRSSGNPSAPAGAVAQGERRPVSPPPIVAPHPIPGPIVNATPILQSIEASLEKPTTNPREFPDWYSLHGRVSGKQLNAPPVATQSLQPPPRRRRPWTASAVPPPKTESVSDSGSCGRASLQGSMTFAAGRRSVDESARSQSPVDSLGTAPGVFGTPEHRPRRASLSSSVSSFTSGAVDRDATLNTSSRRLRLGKLPKMTTPPSGPPPSIPAPRTSSSSQVSNRGSLDRTVHPYAQDQPQSADTNSVSSGFADASLRTRSTSSPPRRTSTSSAPGSTNTATQRLGKFNAAQKISVPTYPTKRASMPPPPRPAPTFALPPTPSQAGKHSEAVTPRKNSFRESFSHRSLRFSLSPPPTKGLPPRPEAVSFGRHRRSLSNDSTGSKNSTSYGKSTSPIPTAPRAPPPTGPLPPTPLDTNVMNRHTSLKERLRLRSAPSSPPPNVTQAPSVPIPAPQSPAQPLISKPLIRMSGIPLGQPISPITSDLNFLNMTPTEPMAPIVIPPHDANFLNLTSPMTATVPIAISPRPPRHSISPLPEPAESSPPTMEMTVLPPPPRRSRQPIVQDKEPDADSDIFPPSSITEDTDEVEHSSVHRGSSVSISRTSSIIAD